MNIKNKPNLSNPSHSTEDAVARTSHSQAGAPGYDSILPAGTICLRQVRADSRHDLRGAGCAPAPRQWHADRRGDHVKHQRRSSSVDRDGVNTLI